MSVHLGPDASWDTRNYHIYNPFALLHKALGTDIVPAQLQSFLSPVVDLGPYWLRIHLNAHPKILDALLGLPAAIAAIVAFRIGLLLLPVRRVGGVFTQRWPLVLLALVFGVTGAAGLPTIGSMASEMPAGCFLLAALWLLLRALDRPGRWNTLLAGCLLGASIGLKLTMAPFAIAAVAVFAVGLPGRPLWRLQQLVGLGAGCVAGAAVAGGVWWWHLYQLTGNPIFPYYNDIFHSPLIGPLAMKDDRFVPHSVAGALLFPFYWGFEKNRRVTELVMRDPRLAFASIALVAYALTSLLRRAPLHRSGACLAWFMAIGFALWEAEFAIFRYLAPLELLCGFTLILALRPLLRRPSTEWVPLTVLAVLCLVTLPFTRYPHWDRALPTGQAASVVMPAMPKNSMVLLLTADPMAYMAAFTDPAIRFIGANNNIVSPGGNTGLSQQVEAAIRAHTGPFWGLEITIAVPPGRTEAVLAYYGLHRGPNCQMVITNLEGPQVQFCPLLRNNPEG